MTEQEAIEKLNMLDEALNFQRYDADECSLALNMAIEALEKQIPKEPIIVHPLQETDSSEFACPICKTGALVKRIDKFCWSCGQAIKWK